MFKTLQNALKMKELRGRLIFTFLMLLVIRFGSQLPVPGVDPDYFADFFNGSNGDAFNLFNAMTGGSFENFSILALLSMVWLLVLGVTYLSEVSPLTSHSGVASLTRA